MVFASGTPAAYQRSISLANPANRCVCSPKTAIENKWITKPVLNLVKGDYSSKFPQIVLSVINREIEICRNEVFKPTILVNFPGIDDIAQFVKIPKIKNQIGVDFHLVTIHSIKSYKDNNALSEVKCVIDNREVKSSEAYETIESIDNDFFQDRLPIIVCQVDMIGEGINVKSFNAVITSSNSDKKVMQQVGRGMRDYTREGKTKVNDGHCNLYMIYDNELQVTSLINNLAEYDLTDECFDWGKRCDIRTGSGEEGDNKPKELNVNSWDVINPDLDLDIREILTKFSKKALNNFKKDQLNFWYKNVENFEENLNAIHKKLKSLGFDNKFYKFFNNKYSFLNALIDNVFSLQKQDPIMREAWKNNAYLFLRTMTKNNDLAKFLDEYLIYDHFNDQLNKILD